MRHMDKETMEISIDQILNLIGLMKDRCTLSKDLSGGMKRRLSIGIALVGDPRVNLIAFIFLYLLIFSRCSFSMNQPVVSVSLMNFSMHF
jgi:ABC-type proline/glycine betaine transport system ATPase subunit